MSQFYKIFKTWDEAPQKYVYDAVKHTVFPVTSETDLTMKLGRQPDGRFPMEIKFGTNSIDALKRHLNQNLYLNVTESCNMRCTYCFFSGNYTKMRTHEIRDMQWSTAQQSIDHFMHHNGTVADKKRSISFFGGEPLLCFPLVIKCIDYVASRYRKHKNISYHLFTNGLLLEDEEICKALVRRNLHIWVSIDGPSHDLNRIDKEGKPTLSAIKKNLTHLRKNYRNFYQTNVVLIYLQTPPFDVESLYSFFCTFKPAQDAAVIDGDIVFGTPDTNDLRFYRFARIMYGWFFIKSNLLPADKKLFSWAFILSRIFFSRKLFKMYNLFLKPEIKPLPDEQRSALDLHTPGLQTTVVGTDGRYYPEVECQEDRFVIGHSSRGYDISRIEKLLTSFQDTINAGAEPCSTCWAHRLCTMEYKNFCFPEKASVLQRKQILSDKARCCKMERSDIETMLSCFQTVLNQSHELDPFEFINQRMYESDQNLIAGTFLLK